MRRFLFVLLVFCALLPGCVRGEAPAASVTEFAAACAAHADRLETDFFIPCDQPVRELVLQEGMAEGNTLLSDIYGNCGIYRLSYQEKKDGIRCFNCRYYEGCRILHAYRSNTVQEALSSEEQQTLQIALDMIAAVSGDELEREKQVHDALCAHVRYYTRYSLVHKDFDCAVGALLYGHADCDGYSDAFYLLGNLAGLEVRYVDGRALPEKDGLEDLDAEEKNTCHMWNAVKVNGKWVMVDVTWDDAGDALRYLYFNNGQDRHLLTHQWDDRALTCTVEASAGNEMRPQGLAYQYAENWDALYPLLRAAAERRAERVCIACAADFDLRAQRQALSDCIYSMGIESYNWSFGGQSAELYGLQYARDFRICDTPQDALNYIDACAERGIRDFSLYFYPPLGPQLFSDGHAPLAALLAQSRLRTASYQYSDRSDHIIITDADYIARFPTLYGQDELLLYLRAQARLRGESFSFYIPPETASVDVTACARSVLYSMGAENFSFSEMSGRYTLSNIQYYDEFCLADTQQQAADYLVLCLRRGVRQCRLYLPDALYREFMANHAQAFFRFLHEYGLQAGNMYYNDQYGMIELVGIEAY